MSDSRERTLLRDKLCAWAANVTPQFRYFTLTTFNTAVDFAYHTLINDNFLHDDQRHFLSPNLKELEVYFINYFHLIKEHFVL